MVQQFLSHLLTRKGALILNVSSGPVVRKYSIAAVDAGAYRM
jgi:short-subunit dehydrogenase involved in D-alanine esterification of teichoic acids